MEKERANEKKLEGKRKGERRRVKETKISSSYLSYLLFLGVFLIFFSVGIRGAGGKGYVSGEKLSGSIQMAGKPLNLCCPVEKNLSFFFCNWHVFESMTRDCNKYLKMK